MDDATMTGPAQRPGSPPTPDLDGPAPSVQRANAAWRRVGRQLRSTTPSDLVHIVMVFGAVAFMGWLAWVTWPALSPFLVGAVIAYALSPLVNRLDRFMPRSLAILVVVGSFVMAVLGLLALLVPAIVSQIGQMLDRLPTPEQVQQAWDRLGEVKTTLPVPVQDLVSELIAQMSAGFRANLVNYVRGLLSLMLSSTVSLFGTIGFVLGFLVVPGWLLSVLSEQRSGVRVMNRLLPAWMRMDFWAIARIADRAMSAFLQGQLIIAIVTTLLSYLGIRLLDVAGLGLSGNQLLLAMLIGVLHLVPQVGPLVAFVLVGVVGLFHSPDMALALVGMLLGVSWLVGRFVSPRLERRMSSIHPTLLVLAIVALSEFGLLWVLVAAPIATIASDLFRYIYGRFSDPALPAGRLPRERVAPPAGRRLARRRHLGVVAEQMPSSVAARRQNLAAEAALRRNG